MAITAVGNDSVDTTLVLPMAIKLLEACTNELLGLYPILPAAVKASEFLTEYFKKYGEDARRGTNRTEG